MREARIVLTRGTDGDALPIVNTPPPEGEGEVSREFAWQFYVRLAAVAIEQRGSSGRSPTPQRADHDANLTDTPDLARWDDDGGAPCFSQSFTASGIRKRFSPGSGARFPLSARSRK